MKNRRNNKRDALRWSVFAACFAAGAQGAFAQAAPFYQGKTIQIVVGFGPGGGYDAYARLIARSMGAHIPGNPTFVVQNMPGAGSRVAANWLYNVAPRDGTALGTIVQSTPVDQVFNEPGVKFDAARFAWIGNPIVDNLVSITTRASGLASMEDVKAKGGLICGSSGGGPTVSFPNAISKLLGTKVQVVAGYPGVSAITLAMERGELNCNGGQAWSSMKATMSNLMKEGKLNVIVQWGAEADPDISATMGRPVPLVQEYARSEAEKAALRLLGSTAALSRPLLGPPDMPADRVQTLRDAFDATMKNAAFLADAKKAGMDIKPLPGAAVQKIVEELVRSKPEDVALAAELVK
jgi:tripartite-type tricarboxylate transporter receptor subunit TctC